MQRCHQLRFLLRAEHARCSRILMALIAYCIGSLLVIPLHDFPYPGHRQPGALGDLLRRLACCDVPQDLPMRAAASVGFVLILLFELLDRQVAGDLYALSHSSIILFSFVSISLLNMSSRLYLSHGLIA